MILTFLGMRGEIDARTRRHRMHTSLLISYRAKRRSTILERNVLSERAQEAFNFLGIV
jgi:hypothetical protein